MRAVAGELIDQTPAQASWTVDTAAPQTTIGSSPASPTNNPQSGLSFTSSEAAGSFECNLDAAGWQPCASPKTYNPLADGPHSVEVRAKDPAGNTDASPAQASWTVDTAAPQTTIGSSPASPTNNPQSGLSFTSSEAAGSFECNLDAAGWQPCASPKTYNPLADGPHSVEVRAKDPAGNTDASPAQASWTVDTAPPQTTKGDGPEGAIGPGPVSFEFSSGDSGATFLCSLDGATASSCPTPYEITDPEPGPHALVVKAVDSAGNIDPAGATYSWDSVSPELSLCGEISQDQKIGPRFAKHYVVTCDVFVAEGATLEVEDGAIVKLQQGRSIGVQGTLEANGTGASPVAFTSWRDDTVGGDTNGDGNATAPLAGDWGGIYTSPAGNGNPNPTLDLDHVKVAYASSPLQASSATTSITNSTIEKAQGDGIAVNSPLGIPTLTGNTVTKVAGNAISIYNASLDMGALDGNSGSANGLNGVRLGADTLAVSSSLPWSGNLVPVLSGGCGSLTIPPGIKLTLGAGTIVKAFANCGGEVVVQGTLEANGTGASPVAFTSWRDDTVGGDTNGDGNATAPLAGDWGGIYTSPAGNGNPNPTLDLDHVKVAYASSPLQASSATTSITNSTIEKAQGDGIAVNSPLGIPTLTGNTVTKVAGNAISIYNASLDMGALDGNSGSANGLNGVRLGADTLAVSSSLPWSGNLVPVLSGGCGSLTIPPGIKLTLGAGTIVKAFANCGGEVVVQGTLEANGTGASPVAFTSWRDDTVGGDTNGDGNATAPLAGDWGGIYTSPAGNGNPNPTLDLDHVKVAYASSPLQASSATTSITNSTIEKAQGDGIAVNSPLGIPTLTGNTVTKVAGNAISIYNASLDMGALDGNSGSANGLNGVRLGADTLAVSSSLPWSGNLVPVLSGGCGSLTIPPGIKLTLGAGTIVKAFANCGGEVVVQGTLEANGTGASPVAFTSWRDDTVGGDTNGDGNATAPLAGDWGGIYTSPAGNGNPNPTLDLDHVKVAYASSPLQASSATTSITNSTIEKAQGDGIAVNSPLGIPTLTGNTVTKVAGNAISIYNASLDMGALDGNSGSANGLNGVRLGADTLAVSSSLPWSGNLVPVLSGGCGSLTIPPGIKLTLGAGTIVKAFANCGGEVVVQGTLEANGTGASPVAFTSWRDDTVGGDTNGDGNATAPLAGDWGGIYTSPAGNGNPNPTLDLDHVKVAYASSPLQASSATTSITNSTIEKAQGDGIAVNSPLGIPTLTGNTVTKVAGNAISIYNASLDMGALDGNSGSANGLNGVRLGADTLAVSSSLPWSGNLVPVLSGGCGSLTIPPGIKLTLGAGTIVKAFANCGGEVVVQGTLEANGTGASPVAFTSWRDDTVGGDTNGDGNATAPLAGDWGGIYTSPAGNGNPNPTLDLDHVKVAYASSPLQASSATTSITNSTIEKAQGDGIAVNSPLGIPTLTGNTVTKVAGNAISIYNASLDMGALDGNSGSANGLNGVRLGADTLAVSSSLPWSGNLVPVLSGGCGSLTIPPGIKLTLGAGTIVKAFANCGGEVVVQGTLEANGTGASPVAFTSWRDDTVGGDTNGDGNATAPLAGDWGGIYVVSGGSAHLLGTTLEYASTALYVADGNDVAIHGAILHSTVGVSANTWVDATHVDWGSPSGPAPGGQGTPIQGDGPMVVPWVGWSPPPMPAVTPQPQSPSGDCATALFVGVRGSGEAPLVGETYSSTESANMGSRIPGIFFAFREEFEKLSPGSTVRGFGLRYPALPVPGPWGAIFGNSYLEFEESFWEGALDIALGVHQESEACPSEKIVLAGYSQGALAIHLALSELMSSADLSHVSAVVLLADPEARGDDNGVTKWGSAATSADGIYTMAFGHGGTAVIPSSVAGRTIAYCHNNDIVCAPGLGSWTSEHSNYSWSEIEPLGVWAADHAAG